MYPILTLHIWQFYAEQKRHPYPSVLVCIITTQCSGSIVSALHNTQLTGQCLMLGIYLWLQKWKTAGELKFTPSFLHFNFASFSASMKTVRWWGERRRNRKKERKKTRQRGKHGFMHGTCILMREQEHMRANLGGKRSISRVVVGTNQSTFTWGKATTEEKPPRLCVE